MSENWAYFCVTFSISCKFSTDSDVFIRWNLCSTSFQKPRHGVAEQSLHTCMFHLRSWVEEAENWFNIKRCCMASIRNPIVEVRRFYDRLISTMGFPILARQYFYIESGPRYQGQGQVITPYRYCVMYILVLDPDTGFRHTNPHVSSFTSM